MESAASEICSLGREMVETHRVVGGRAEEVLENWKLAERLVGEREALGRIFQHGRLILEHLRLARETRQPGAMRSAAEVIDKSLPEIERAFLIVRHCAQDLLHWVQRFAPIEQSTLPARYRASYARLIAYAPVLKPRLETFQQELVDAVEGGSSGRDTRALLSAITRYNGSLDSARRFVRAVVDPPLDLVFRESEEFVGEMQQISLESRAELASNLNDCCQSLQYDRASFDRRVRPVAEHRPEQGESSLVVFGHGKYQVLFTVEEDPIFDQMTVHLLRVVEEGSLQGACESVTRALQEEWE